MLATTLATCHVAFQLDLGITTSSTQSHPSLPSGHSQSPPESFATPPGPSDSGTNSETQSESGAESGTDSGSARPASRKHRYARAVPSPRACRNIKNIRRVGPAGNKHRSKALDVWSFFVCEEQENVCVFCKYAVSSFQYVVYKIDAVLERFMHPITSIALLTLVCGHQLDPFATIYLVNTEMTGSQRATNLRFKSSHHWFKVPTAKSKILGIRVSHFPTKTLWMPSENLSLVMIWYAFISVLV